MRRSSIFWGLILILAAALLLLKNLGIISSFFNYFWILVLLFVGIWLIVGAFIRSTEKRGEKASVPLDGATSASISLDHGAGHLKLHSGATPGNLLDGNFSPLPVLKTTAEAGKMSLKVKYVSDFMTWLPGESRDWDISLANDIPLTLDIDSGASTSIYDLHDLKVTELILDTGASTTDITLPANAGTTRVKIESGAATVKIRVPDGVAAQIHIESGMASISVSGRFPKAGSHLYLSPDYNSAANRADITVETGMATVEIC